MKKIGELKTKTAWLVIYHEPGKTNPYRIVRKWYDGGWHVKTEESYGELTSAVIWLYSFVMKEAGWQSGQALTTVII